MDIAALGKKWLKGLNLVQNTTTPRTKKVNVAHQQPFLSVRYVQIVPCCLIGLRMSKDKINSPPDLPCLIMRSILNSKSLDDFCKRLSLIITDMNLDCSIHKLGNLQVVEVLGSNGNNAITKQIDYPSEIRASLIRSLINGSPAWFHKKNHIWSEG